MVRISFEYEYRDTFLHNMNPIPVAFMCVFLAGLVIMWWDIPYLLAVLAVALVMARKSLVPFGWLKVLLLIGIFATILSAFFGSVATGSFIFMSDPTFFKKLPPEFTTREIFQITPKGFPLLGYTAITYGSLSYFIALLLKFPSTVVLACVLVWSVNPSDLFQYFVTLHFPNQITLPVMAAFRFFPIMTQTMSNIVNAQALRGWTVRKVRSPIRLVRMLVPFTLPLARQFVKTVDIVTISTLNRGFGIRRMSPRKALKMSALEWVLVLLLPPLFVVVFYLTVTPPWYIGAI